jgi:curved DNA-binding protein CbpA
MNISGTEFINHYKILGVAKDASNKEIRAAYKNLCLIYHPDKPTGNAVMFEQINDSYAILKDTSLRQQYDLSLDITVDALEFNNLKNAFSTYIKTPDNFITKPDESLFKPTIVGNKDDKIKGDDNILEDLDLIREQDDLEGLPEKIFENGEEFNADRFNEKFDEVLSKLNDNDGLGKVFEQPFMDSCRPTNLDDSFKSPTMPEAKSEKNKFLNQFDLIKGVKSTRSTSDKIDNNYFAKLLADRDNIFETIEYTNEIVDGVDYKAIGF